MSEVRGLLYLVSWIASLRIVQKTCNLIHSSLIEIKETMYSSQLVLTIWHIFLIYFCGTALQGGQVNYSQLPPPLVNKPGIENSVRVDSLDFLLLSGGGQLSN